MIWPFRPRAKPVSTTFCWPLPDQIEILRRSDWWTLPSDLIAYYQKVGILPVRGSAWISRVRAHGPVLTGGEPFGDYFTATNLETGRREALKGSPFPAVRLSDTDEALRLRCLDLVRGDGPITSDHIPLALQVWWFATGMRPMPKDEHAFETTAREAREAMFPDKPETKS